MRKKLTKTERVFDEIAENKKDIIAYDSVVVYAASDIPLPVKPVRRDDFYIPTPRELWADFDPETEYFDATVLSSDDRSASYSICAEHRPDGDLTVAFDVFNPSYFSKKAVIIVGERTRAPQKELIDAILSVGAYAVVVDYNGRSPSSETVFPPSLSYGKFGEEGDRLTRLSPTAKDTCAYLYTLLFRRVLAFVKREYGFTDVIAAGIRDGAEIAMRLAGCEKEKICALGCVCEAGYPEYSDVPRYPDGVVDFDDETIAFISSLSGVSYLKDYPHPVFAAIGSNGEKSDVDRLSALGTLVKGTLTVSITQKYSDCVDEKALGVFIDWLNQSFWKSDFPHPPETSVEVNRDGTVYASVVAQNTPKIKSLTLYYSYNNPNHKTRSWSSSLCETVGDGQYLAKMDFDAQCADLYFYTETHYVNGLISTEQPKYLDLSEYRIYLSPSKSTAVLFRHGADGEFIPVSDDPVAASDSIEENVVPSGAKGTVCRNGAMRLFVGDATKYTSSSKLLQADAYSPVPGPIELVVRTGSSVEYRATKRIAQSNTFTGVRFACSDFKDELFRPLAAWSGMTSVTVVTPNVTLNKLTFI